MPSTVYRLSTERGYVVWKTEEHIMEGDRWKKLELFYKQQLMRKHSC